MWREIHGKADGAQEKQTERPHHEYHRLAGLIKPRAARRAFALRAAGILP